MNQRSALRETAIIGCWFVAFLVVVGVLIAPAIGEPPVAFLTNLFTDPLWLFTIAIGLYFSVTAYRRVKSKSVKT